MLFRYQKELALGTYTTLHALLTKKVIQLGLYTTPYLRKYRYISQMWQIRTSCYIQVGRYMYLGNYIYTHFEPTPPPLMKFLSTTGYNRPSLNPTHTHPNKNQSKLVSAHSLRYQTFHKFIRSKRPPILSKNSKENKNKNKKLTHTSTPPPPTSTPAT